MQIQMPSCVYAGLGLELGPTGRAEKRGRRENRGSPAFAYPAYLNLVSLTFRCHVEGAGSGRESGALRNDLIDPTIAVHSGRVVKRTVPTRSSMCPKPAVAHGY
jgi:hypothetical protein